MSGNNKRQRHRKRLRDREGLIEKKERETEERVQGGNANVSTADTYPQSEF